MAEQEKETGFVDKAVDFLSDAGDKITDFAQEHGLDDKIDTATDAIEKGAMNVFNSIKNSFGNKAE